MFYLLKRACCLIGLEVFYDCSIDIDVMTIFLGLRKFWIIRFMFLLTNKHSKRWIPSIIVCGHTHLHICPFYCKKQYLETNIEWVMVLYIYSTILYAHVRCCVMYVYDLWYQIVLNVCVFCASFLQWIGCTFILFIRGDILETNQL